MRNISELIEKFISQVLAKYPNIYIEYSYDEELDEYDIWHNNQELEFNNTEFSQYIGEQAEELLFKNKIYNFSFSYNYSKAKELEGETKLYNMINLQDVSYRFTHIVAGCRHSNYSRNINIDKNSHLNMEFKSNDSSNHSGRRKEYKIEPTNYKGSTLYEMNLIEVAS